MTTEREHLKAEKNINAKLTWEKVEQIRGSKLNNTEAAKFFGVCASTIHKIRRFKSWKVNTK